MIISLGREFGVPLSLDDIPNPELSELDGFSSFRQAATESNQLEPSCRNVEFEDVQNQKTYINKRESLDMKNDAFDELIKARKSGHIEPVDYINGNIVSKHKQILIYFTPMYSISIKPFSYFDWNYTM